MKANRPVVLEFGQRACCFNNGRLFADDFPNRSCVSVGFTVKLEQIIIGLMAAS